MEAHASTPRLTAVRREEERVTALELFFDLVFVLALTQCTALIANDADVAGARPGAVRARGALVVVGRLRVADERRRSGGRCRAASRCSRRWPPSSSPRSPCRDAFGDDALVFACAYGIVRVAHIWLFTIASRDDPGLRRSVTGLAGSTAVGVSLLVAASFTDGVAAGSALGDRDRLRRRRPVPLLRRGLEADAGALRRAPRADRDHRARRVDRRDRRRRRRDRRRRGDRRGHARRRARGGALVALLRRDRLARRAGACRRRRPGREQNELARDSYSIIHFPLVAGIVLAALRAEEDARARRRPARTPFRRRRSSAASRCTSSAMSRFRWRQVHSLSRQRSLAAPRRAPPLPRGAGGARRSLTLALVLAVVCLPDRLRGDAVRGEPRARPARARARPCPRSARRDREDGRVTRPIWAPVAPRVHRPRRAARTAACSAPRPPGELGDDEPVVARGDARVRAPEQVPVLVGPRHGRAAAPRRRARRARAGRGGRDPPS